MAYTADGKKVRKGMKLWDRPWLGNRKVTVQEVRGDMLNIGGGCGVTAKFMYSSEKALSIANRVLILGGAFDPIHNGHLIACRSLAEELGIKDIILIPSNNHPDKPNMTSAKARMDMVKLAAEQDCSFQIGYCEFDRKGKSYSIETASWIKNELGKNPEEIYWMIGADNVNEISKWHQAEKLVKEVRFVVANRKTSNSVFVGTNKEKKIIDKMHIEYVDTPIIEISSSMIRDRVKNDKSIHFLVPDNVAAYIEENNLYR